MNWSSQLYGRHRFRNALQKHSRPYLKITAKKSECIAQVAECLIIRTKTCVQTILTSKFFKKENSFVISVSYISRQLCKSGICVTVLLKFSTFVYFTQSRSMLFNAVFSKVLQSLCLTYLVCVDCGTSIF
jgi:hypothetical protein